MRAPEYKRSTCTYATYELHTRVQHLTPEPTPSASDAEGHTHTSNKQNVLKGTGTQGSCRDG